MPTLLACHPNSKIFCYRGHHTLEEIHYMILTCWNGNSEGVTNRKTLLWLVGHLEVHYGNRHCSTGLQIEMWVWVGSSRSKGCGYVLDAKYISCKFRCVRGLVPRTNSYTKYYWYCYAVLTIIKQEYALGWLVGCYWYLNYPQIIPNCLMAAEFDLEPFKIYGLSIYMLYDCQQVKSTKNSQRFAWNSFRKY